MRQLTSEELDDRWADVEAAVDATPGIDPWCSGPDWQLPVADGFAPSAARLLLATDDGTGYALLSEHGDHDDHGAPVLGGLEPLWGFGSPIIGPDPGAVAAELADHLTATGNRSSLLLPGLPPLLTTPEDTATPGRQTNAEAPRQTNADAPRPANAEAPRPSPADPGPAGLDAGQRTTLPVATALTGLGRVGLGRGITRLVTDLTGGIDAWLERRSARFRRNLRRATRTAERAGLRLVDAAADPDLFDRILAIEQRSWKGRDRSGITNPEMTATYRTMVDRLRTRGRLQATVAVLDGHDAGYILGGLRARRYRGLQLSYTVDAAALSIGNLLQVHQLSHLVTNDLADTYDLGMDFDYKRRWADRSEPSAIVVVRR